MLTLLFTGARLPATELHPDLLLPPMGPPQYDVTRRGEEPRGTTVRSRSRPEVAPLGARFGSFLVLPEVDLRLGYNDNLRATENESRADLYSVIEPRLEMRTDWSRHALKAGAQATHGRYQDVTAENYDDWRVFADTRLDLGRASAVFGRISAARLHEDRAAPETTNTTEVSTYRVVDTEGGWSHPFGRFDLQLQAGLSDYDFDTVDTTGLPPGFLVGDDRDRQARRSEARLRYAAWPGYGAFVRAAYNTQEYEARAPDGTDRDSKGYEVGLGVDLELTNLIFGDAFVSYYHQNYAAPGFEDTGGLGFGANLHWNPTMLTTVHLGARRSVQESTLPNASGYESTHVTLELDHELLRNLLLSGGTSFTRRSYQELNREEELVQYHFGVNYMTNRYLNLRLRVVHRTQDGSGGGRDFTQNYVEQSVVLRY